jgi:hypothetical protein
MFVPTAFISALNLLIICTVKVSPSMFSSLFIVYTLSVELELLIQLTFLMVFIVSDYFPKFLVSKFDFSTHDVRVLTKWYALLLMVISFFNAFVSIAKMKPILGENLTFAVFLLCRMLFSVYCMMSSESWLLTNLQQREVNVL